MAALGDLSTDYLKIMYKLTEEYVEELKRLKWKAHSDDTILSFAINIIYLERLKTRLRKR